MKSKRLKSFKRWAQNTSMILLGLVLSLLDYLAFVLDRLICVFTLNSLTAFKIWREIPEYKTDSYVRIVIWSILITVYYLIF
jgi:hypothetical protein